MWVSKPIYESLPYFYLLSGVLLLLGGMYLNHWHWPTLCLATGLGCLAAGMLVLLKRREHRHRERRSVVDHRG